MKIIIAGGGIGGLTAALLLRKAGFEVKVFESVKEVKPLGVGINLLPHSVTVLNELGLVPKLAQIAVSSKALLYYNKFGQKYWEEPRGLYAGYKVPQFSIHRGKFQQLLFEEAKAVIGKENIFTNHHLQSFKEEDDKIIAGFIDHSFNEFIHEETGDALIGADGIHSVVRKYFYPNEGEPKFTGITLWRAVTETTPNFLNSSMVMIGNTMQKFVAYPIREDATSSTINWIAEIKNENNTTPPKRDWNKKVNKEVFLPAFRSWKFDWLDIPALIEAAGDVFEFPMIDRDPLPRWTFGRITLLGDAAHPMYPIGSNGASQAILDAKALTENLIANNDIQKALVEYERIRLEPTSKIVLSNRENGPDKIMEIMEQRAPNGFENLDDVISKEELQEVANQYKKIAGFEKKV
ncbi:flavin-dependent oxidoreductase [Panacibacter ginsenosidivorans]|uniref:Flavin-dependent oxidoreductase n=1 Tax=Panacibacter ginsenosidivorans TaxID=1813871 RepID=A0A5B8V6M0_9BACT|nr:flavin-dependent oxidoreductase [Panacibacter ginsenosidivorans]QEC66859.1 flavin-dependent oxidoreductase [Panacibacter ginsenosidivorans]